MTQQLASESFILSYLYYVIYTTRRLSSIPTECINILHKKKLIAVLRGKFNYVSMTFLLI